MQRATTLLGIKVGGAAGVMVGTSCGIMVALDNLFVGIVGGALRATALGGLGIFVGAKGARLYNRLAELMDPQVIPPDGPGADYHDIPLPSLSTDRRD